MYYKDTNDCRERIFYVKNAYKNPWRAAHVILSRMPGIMVYR